MFPTGGQFMAQFGVVPVSMPYSDVQMAIQTGMLDGVCWSGITEDYTVGWADVCKYYLTNPISGGWSGGWFVNTKAWEKVPEHLKQLFMLTIQRSHYQRLHWYWWGEANYRVKGGKLQLTTIPANEWAQVEKAALKFWDETAKKSPRAAKVVQILKDYNDTMVQGRPSVPVLGDREYRLSHREEACLPREGRLRIARSPERHTSWQGGDAVNRAHQGVRGRRHRHEQGGGQVRHVPDFPDDRHPVLRDGIADHLQSPLDLDCGNGAVRHGRLLHPGRGVHPDHGRPRAHGPDLREVVAEEQGARRRSHLCASSCCTS